MDDRKHGNDGKGGAGFGTRFAPVMARTDYRDGAWGGVEAVPFAPSPASPAWGALHYGQAVFEGLKAYRWADGQWRLFRPDLHARRLRASCRRLCIPEVPEGVFRQALSALFRGDPAGAAYYVRVIVFAADTELGVKAARTYGLQAMACPDAPYFAGRPLRLRAELELARAFPGGLGAAKTPANYAAGLYAAARAKAAGWDDVLWTDARTHRLAEEAGAMNIFFRIGDELHTPALTGTFLEGVTRDSALALAQARGWHCVEGPVDLGALREAHGEGRLLEAFGTGTAAGIVPVGALGLGDAALEIGGPGEWTSALAADLDARRKGEAADPEGWAWEAGK